MPEQPKTYDQLTITLAKQFAMPPDEFRKAVISQCFPGGAATDYQLTQFLMVAYNRQLNPFERGEIYAFVNKYGVLTIGTGIDGWIKIAHRQPTFRGYKATELFNEQGEFVGVHMQMFREGWTQPGEYTAYLSEWNKNVLNAAGWQNQPRHLTFAKAWQECTRFTFQVTDLVDVDDIHRMEETDAARADQPIYQPGPAEPPAIEHQPTEPANFLDEQVLRQERQRAEALRSWNTHLNADNPTGHLRVKVELPERGAVPVDEDSEAEGRESGGLESDALMTPVRESAASTRTARNNATAGDSSASPPEHAAVVQGQENAAADPESQTHARGGNAGSTPAGSSEQPTEAGTSSADSLTPPPGSPRRGRPAGSRNKPKNLPPGEDVRDGSTIAAEAAADRQAAAGLEVIDPAESELETFIRAHDLEPRRVEQQLAKFGADKVSELSTADAARVLAIFKQSVALMEASKQ